MRLGGKVCIVTGAGSGIGRASAELFAAEGATVVAADLEGTAYRVDVADEDGTRALVASVVDEHGRIDVLFNNAGIAGVGDVEETTLELWERVMRVNVRGVFLMSRAAVPTMVAQRAGSIINMSSAIAETGLGRRVSYAASKGAVLALTKSMQVDLAPYGVRVNALMPGTIMTPFVERYLAESYEDPEEGRRSIRSRQLTGELGKPEDVVVSWTIVSRTTLRECLDYYIDFHRMLATNAPWLFAAGDIEVGTLAAPAGMLGDALRSGSRAGANAARVAREGRG